MTEAWQHAFKAGDRVHWITDEGERGVITDVSQCPIISVLWSDAERITPHDAQDLVLEKAPS